MREQDDNYRRIVEAMGRGETISAEDEAQIVPNIKEAMMGLLQLRLLRALLSSATAPLTIIAAARVKATAISAAVTKAELDALSLNLNLD